MRMTYRRCAAALAVALTAGLLAVPQASVAQETGPTITAPADGARFSIILDDANSSTEDFQLEVEGTGEENSEVSVCARRPDEPPEESQQVADVIVGLDGLWSTEVDLEGGEWLLDATPAAEGEGDACTEARETDDVRVLIVLRYVFTWYDDKGSAGNWILIGNPDPFETVRADIFIDGTQRGSTLTVDPFDAAAARFEDVVGGPVVVDSLDGVPLVVTQRTTWTKGNFEEVPGVLDGDLATESWFSWYDTRNSGNRDWIVVTNFGGDDATVAVTADTTTIPPTQTGGNVIPPGESSVFKLDDFVGGPVRITSDEPVLAARRTLWKPGNFTEITAVPDEWLEDTTFFTWYDAKNSNGNWIMVVNPGETQADVEVFIGPGQDPALEFTVEPGAATPRQIPGAIGGSVEVFASQPVFVSQRALWAGGNSFEEISGVGLAAANDAYWQSWYDETSADAKGDWMMQADVYGAGTDYIVDAGFLDEFVEGTIEPFETNTERFPGEIGGPLVVESQVPIVHSKRTLWGSGPDFMELIGIRGSVWIGFGLPRRLAAPEPVEVEQDGDTLLLSWAELEDPTYDGFWVYRSSETEPRRRVGFIFEYELGACGDPEDEEDPLNDRYCFIDPDVDTSGDVTYDYDVAALSIATVEGVAGSAQWPAEASE